MSYFKIGDVDFSNVVSSLTINTDSNYTAQTNAAGDTVVDFINRKREIEVEIIAIDDVKMLELQQAIDPFSVSISFLNPKTNVLEENVSCIIPSDAAEYYTIQKNRVLFKAMSLKFTEL